MSQPTNRPTTENKPAGRRPGRGWRRAAAALTAVATLAGGATAVLAAPSQAGPAPMSASMRAGHAARGTILTVRGRTCTGCRVMLYNDDGWHSRNALMRHGKATFHISKAHTRGMSIGVEGPWERTSPHPSGFNAMVVLRYAWAGSEGTISYAEARHSHYGSVCWAGTSAHRRTLTIQARKVTVPGTTGPAYSTLAWASPSKVTVRGTLERVDKGLYGSQAVPDC